MMILFFFFFLKDRSSLQYFITQGMGQSSMFLTFSTICNFRGRTLALVRGKEESQGSSIPVYYETCFKIQPAHKPLITRRGSFPLRGLLFFSN